MSKKISVLIVISLILAGVWLSAAQKLPPPADKGCQKKMEKAEKAMKNKDPEGALALYREVMRAEPNYAPAYFLAAVACRMKQDHDQAQTLLEKALAVQPGFKPALSESLNLLNSLAQQMNAHNQPDKAYGYYARIAALPGLEDFQKAALIEASYNMGISSFQAQRFEQSVKAFRKMLAIPGIEIEGKQHYVLAQYMMGVDLSMLNQGDESSSFLRKYLELVSSDPADGFAPVAAYLVAKHEYSLLEGEIEKLKADSSVPDLKEGIERLAKARGTIPELLQKGITGRPDIEECYVLLSNYYYYFHDLDNAIAVCRTLIEKFPASASLEVYKNFLKKLENEKNPRGAEAEKK